MSNSRTFDALVALANIQLATGSNDKKALLSKYKDMTELMYALKLAYDPYVRTGIGLKKLGKVAENKHSGEVHIDLATLYQYFKDNPTGSMENVSYARKFVDQFGNTEAVKKIAEQLVTKTLKIGITAKTLNKVYGANFIPMIGIMRAENYQDFKEKVGGPFIATEKIDGVRRLLIKENGKVSLYSRSGIPDDGLVDIEAEARYLPDNCVYDGELTAIGKFNSALELRQATTSIANKTGVRKGLYFNIFDMIPLGQYKTGKSNDGSRARKVLLAAIFGDETLYYILPSFYKTAIQENKIDYDFKFLRAVPIEGIATTEEEILLLAKPIWDRKFEGLMLNTFEGLYDYTKTKSRDILKVKMNEEITLTVIDMEAGRPGTKNAHRLGSLIVDYKGFSVGVGSGIDDPERDAWWANPSAIIGKQIEIEHFGETKNKNNDDLSLNCPIFKRVAGAVE